MLLRYTALAQNGLDLLLGNHQRVCNLCFLMHLDPLADLVMDSLYQIHAAILMQSGGEQSLKGLLLFRGGLGRIGVKDGLHECFMALLDVLGVHQGIVNVCGAVVEGREQETQLRSGDHLVDGAVVEKLFFCHIVQIGLGLLDRTDGANKEGVAFLALILLEGIVLALEGHVIGFTAQQDQVVFIEGHRVDDLLIQLVAKLLVLTAAFPQFHQQLVLRRIRHLSGLEGDVDQILSDGAGEGALEQGKILFAFVLGHNAERLAEFRNDLLVVIDVAAIDIGHITAIPAQVPPELADFLIIHGLFLAYVKSCFGIIAQEKGKIQKKKPPD